MDNVIIIGAGGHALSVLESAECRIAGFIDEFKTGSYYQYKIIGNSIYDINDRWKYSYHIAIGNVLVRNRWREVIEALGLKMTSIIDRTANVSDSATVKEGCYIGKMAVIDANVVVGKNCIVNTGAIIEHGSIIGNDSNISTGAVINGDVVTGERVMIGSNSVCNGQLEIKDDVTVGSGAVVVGDVRSNVTVVGVPAKEIAL